MDIKTLVIIGFILILVSSCLFFYINMDNLISSLKYFKLNQNFKLNKTSELSQIDQNISNELKDKNSDYDKLKTELEDLKNAMENKDKSATVPEDTPIINKEVFLVDNNIFSRSEAPKVCQALFNSDSANKAQLTDSFNNGANWCNYGWTSDGDAYYPLQQDTNNSVCEGSVGLNGGPMAEKDYKLGALCYGVKPDDTKFTSLNQIHRESTFSESDQKMLENYRKKLANGGIKIAAFNDKAWSRYSYKTDTLAINNNLVVSSKKECSNDPQALDTNKSKIQAII
jgi:hypothetical protein